MNENTKLKEANYFLDKMRKVKANYEEFVFNLSAFISSARSVMQYMEAETKAKNNSSWYEKKMLGSDILRFFRSNRDLNIHVVPIRLQKGMEVPILNLSPTIASTSISSSGGVIFTTIPLSSSSSSSSSRQVDQSIDNYKFDPNWYATVSINEHFKQSDKDLCMKICQKYNVLTFCENYIYELNTIVDEGIDEGYITG